ncbi:Na(+)/dicarboxylate cotransporter 3-like [Amphiura filiformis]|uniref:Na(+)/dicarboxylate cotransporter 3-like n=1 Tax=Amphiura filiformis TaxID=82378 RepID=UPI003B212315
MAYAFPGMVICLLLTWVWLQFFYIDRWCCRGLQRNRSDANIGQSDRVTMYIRKSYDDLGPMSYAEVLVSIHVCLVALLWISRDPKFIPGWASFFKAGYISDSTAGMSVAMLLFVMPSKPPQFLCGFRKKGSGNGHATRVPTLLEWDVVGQKMAWNVFFLLGGGFALAEASKESGLSDWLGQQFLILKDFSPEVMALLIAIIVAAFTEITNNTSTASIFLPILAALVCSL